MRATVSMWRGHRQTWLIAPVTIKRQVPEHGAPQVILSVMEQIPDQHSQAVPLHGPSLNLSVLILRKQLLQLTNKMQILSVLMQIQQFPWFIIQIFRRLELQPLCLLILIVRLFIGYLEKPQLLLPAAY